MARESLDQFFSAMFDKYGMTPIEYRAAYRAQGGKCYICRRADGSTRRLGVDHDHFSNEIRALLCTGSRDPKTCNRLIGYYNRDALVRAAEVLSDPPPLRAVLEAVRSGDSDIWIPSVVGNKPFRVSDIKR